MPEAPSAILTALYRGDREAAAHLGDAAASLTIWEAAALGRTADVEARLDEDPDLVNAPARDGFHPLALAAFFGHPEGVRLLLARGADVAAAALNEMKVQALHAAVAGRSPEAVALLLEHGADVNARQQVGYTPLMGAASAGREDLVDLLLARGADRSLVSDDGKSAASVAREHGHEALARRLETA